MKRDEMWWSKGAGHSGASRMKLRIRETTDDTGYRARQLLKISHSLPLMDGLSAYVGDEILFYRNQNSFGK